MILVHLSVTCRYHDADGAQYNLLTTTILMAGKVMNGCIDIYQKFNYLKTEDFHHVNVGFTLRDIQSAIKHAYKRGYVDGHKSRANFNPRVCIDCFNKFIPDIFITGSISTSKRCPDCSNKRKSRKAIERVYRCRRKKQSNLPVN